MLTEQSPSPSKFESPEPAKAIRMVATERGLTVTPPPADPADALRKRVHGAQATGQVESGTDEAGR